MKRKAFFTLLFVCAIITHGMAQNTYVIIAPGDTLWWGAVPEMTQEIEDEINQIPPLVLSPASENTVLPYKVDNSIYSWMRPIFKQEGNSCAQSAAVGYTFTYEINRLRNLSSSDTVNQYPPDFTYNFLNSGNSQNGSYPQHGFRILKESGCPDYVTYGGMWAPITKWISGYDMYYSALKNRVKEYDTIDLFKGNGFYKFKHWLNDHGNGDTTGGLAVFTVYGVRYPMVTDEISEGEEAGKHIITNWDSDDPEQDIGGHSMTIVGYNDSIKYDFNNDGIYSNWEYGAVKVANSWRVDWPGSDNGYVYVSYHMLEESIDFVFVMEADSSYQPEIVLKAEIDHNFRNQLNFIAGYAENTDSIDPTIRKLYTAFNGKGGPYPMQGINYDPLEAALDFSHWFADSTVGKVFFQIHRIGSYNYGTIDNFSLVDYRWDEILEVPCDNVDFPYTINEGDNTFSIDYDVLPFTIPNLSNPIDTILTNKVVRKQTVLKTLDTLTITSFNNIDFYFSELIIESGATLIVSNNVQFHAKQGDCKITVNGSIQLGSNVTFIADEGSTLEINFGYQPVNIDNCVFENCTVKSASNPISISNSTFTNSTFSAVNNSSSMLPYTAILEHNTFETIDPEQTAIYLYNYANFEIDSNSISKYFNGIQLDNSGSGTAGNQNIYLNTIDSCYMYGISTYNSTASISSNHISGNIRGVGFLNRSNVAFYGNPLLESYSLVNLVENNSSYEVYSSYESFPWYFRYNAISDYDNSGGSSDAQIYFEVPQGGQNKADVRYNCWDVNFEPSSDLYPVASFTYDSRTDTCPDPGHKSTEIALDDFQQGLDYFENEQYADAKTSFESIIQLYPKTQYAGAAMKELFALEKFADNDYVILQQYYENNDSIQADTVLTKLAIFLSNKCEIELQNWQTAIDHFESVIENPDTPEDSIFAIIDLGYTYLLMGDSGYKSTAQGRLLQHKPTSPEVFSSKRDYLISLLPFEKSSSTSETLTDKNKKGELLQNIPNPFSNTTSIQFNLNSGEFSSVEIRIHDQVGKEVMYIPVKSAKEGSNTVELNMQGLPSGIYYYSLIVNGAQADTKKMVVVR